MRSLLFTFFGLFVLAVAHPMSCDAQSIRIDLNDVSLEQALGQFRSETGIDLVFAHRLVSGQNVSCFYEGGDIEEALDCLLEGTNLHAEKVRRTQYVIVAVGHDQGQKVRIPRGTLNGFVVDVESGETLPGAHVYLPSLKIGSITNTAGYFAISALPVGMYRVRVSYLGFQPLDSTLMVGSSAAILKLKTQTILTDSILIEERRTEFSDAVSLPGVVHVPVSDLEKLPAFPGEQDLFQALQWFPGVLRTGEINGALLVRGGEPDQNLFLLDGAPIYHPWHAFSLVSTFQTETFRDIKLYRGSFPAEFGGRLAAVLDANMKDGNRANPRATVGLSLLNARMVIETPITSKSSFMFAGRRSYLDKIIGREHPVVGEDGRRDTLRTGYYFYDISGKLSYRPNNRHMFSISHYRGKDDLDLRLPFDLSLDMSSWLRPADLFFEIDQNWGNQLFSVRHQYLHSPKLFLTTTAYYSAYQAQESAYIRPTTSSAVDSDYNVQLGDFGVRIDADYYHSLLHQLRGGIQIVNRYFRSGLNAELLRSPEAMDSLDQASRVHAREVVFYIQDAWRLSQRWHIQPGIRFSLFSNGPYWNVNPRLNVQYALLPRHLFIRGGVGSQIQYVHRLRDRYSFLYDLVSSRWIPVGQAVRPSTSRQIAAGLESYPASWLAITADVYYRHSGNVLFPRDEYRTKDGLEGPGIDVGALLGQYLPGESRAYGVELTGRFIHRPWQIWLNYAGGRSLIRVPELGDDDYRAGRYDVPRSLRGIINYSIHPWLFTVAGEARSGYPNSVPVARYLIGDPLDEDPLPYLYRPDVNNGRLPPYFRLDASIGYQFRFLDAQWRVQVQIYNFINRRNVIARYYDPRQTMIQPDDRRGLPLVPLFDIVMEL